MLGSTVPQSKASFIQIPQMPRISDLYKSISVFRWRINHFFTSNLLWAVDHNAGIRLVLMVWVGAMMVPVEKPARGFSLNTHRPYLESPGCACTRSSRYICGYIENFWRYLVMSSSEGLESPALKGSILWRRRQSSIYNISESSSRTVVLECPLAQRFSLYHRILPRGLVVTHTYNNRKWLTIWIFRTLVRIYLS
jgi:hypothetical protein